MQNPIQAAIVLKLQQALSPDHLDVINESANHNVPVGSESHFKVIAVSQYFEGKRAVARHQAVYQILAQELKGSKSGVGVHALALHLYTPGEWAEQQAAPISPPCLGA
ncbi:BolA family protein [Marinagarivorans algicola]|uniref:BolA family protein n=1 Tax=Marinagarivorans algicola TaxID=1513270 RepID=UPI0006B95135|nr:BolA/IbaG family iron-sulfur metabolism protein [Marinagarivorans algicola]